MGKKEGMHNVHALSFEPVTQEPDTQGIAEVCGGVAEIQGLEPGSSPTSGTVSSLFSGL